MRQLIKSAIAGAMLLATSVGANALTLELNDLATGTNPDVSWTQVSSPVNFSGTVGAFEVSLAGTSFTNVNGLVQLDTNSVQTLGVGNLRISARQNNINLDGTVVNLDGSATVSNGSSLITVRHFYGFGASAWTLIEGPMSFVGPINQVGFQGDTVATSVPSGVDKLKLLTIVDITTTQADQQANVNASLMAAVPLPAGGLLLLSALGGLGLARRRRKAA